MPEGARYRPLKALHCGGIIMLEDLQGGAGDDEELVEQAAAGGTTAASKPGEGGGDEPALEEPGPPEPFEFAAVDY